jgi:hypothetical protein
VQVRVGELRRQVVDEEVGPLRPLVRLQGAPRGGGWSGGVEGGGGGGGAGVNLLRQASS